MADVGVLVSPTVLTPRLEVRLPVESDRQRFVELFRDERFMVHSAGVLDSGGAHRRFDEMLERAAELPFAKQPVIELRTGCIIGYSGVNCFEFEEQRHLEYGYRLVPEARGKGYATEAGRALLALAEETFAGEILAMIDPRTPRRRTSPASSASCSGSRRSSTGSSTTSIDGRSARRPPDEVIQKQPYRQPWASSSTARISLTTSSGSLIGTSWPEVTITWWESGLRTSQPR